MTLSRRNFLKVSALSAAAVAGAALFTGCSGQLLLPVQFSSAVIGADNARKLDERKFTVLDGLSEDAQKKAINAFVQGELPEALCEVGTIERKTSHLDGKESDYLYVTLKGNPVNG